ncbi:hypothetical protein [Cytobacillus pseudoceanisediminis]|uniref:hypothetical protein n=1 Tax=Cytobacillus pseudoceanisediminis TaxID=3051614 RepID=UPI003C2CCD23
MVSRLPMRSPWIRHEDPNTDIFGTHIVLWSEAGFANLYAEEIQKIVVLKRKNTAEIHYKNGDIVTCYDFSTHDFNEFLCWTAVNNLKKETS